MRLQDVILRGTRANQPAATTVPWGTLYYITDEEITEQSDGTDWNSYYDLSKVGIITRVVPTGVTRTIPDEHSLTVADYYSVEGTGSLVIEGDGALLVI